MWSAAQQTSMVALYDVSRSTETTVSTAAIIHKLGTRSGALTRPEAAELVACIRRHRGTSVNVHKLVQWLRRAHTVAKPAGPAAVEVPGGALPPVKNPRRMRGPAARAADVLSPAV
jgi:hypothetical protein